MLIEAALVKPVVDALLTVFKQTQNIHLQHNAEAALREAIRELLLANPNENKAAARIAIAKAAGIISEDIVLAEDMLNKHLRTKARASARSSASRKRSIKDDDETACMTKTTVPSMHPPQRKS